MKKCVGIDVGYGYLKVAVEGEETYVNRSVVATYEGNKIATEMNDYRTDTVITHEDQKYICGYEAYKHGDLIIETLDADWIDTTAYQVLLKLALEKATAASNNYHLIIVSGLPVGAYRRDKDKLKRIITNTARGYCRSPEVKVTTQALGAFYSCYKHANEAERNFLNKACIGIVDIGYYTTDFITIDNHEVIEREVKSINTGMSVALERIQSDLNQVGISRDMHVIEKSVMDGVIIDRNAEKNIAGLIGNRLKNLADVIVSQARSIWGNAGKLNRIYLTGGGAELLISYISDYPQIRLMKDAQLANAMGYLLIAQHLGVSKEG